MAYVKQNFTDGQVLTAEQLNHMEEGIEAANEKEAPTPAKLATVNLLASAWSGGESLYSQVVTVEGVTPYSKVDLLPSVEQLASLFDGNFSFVTENEGGVVTVYAIGDKPTRGYTMQAQITEVAV